MQKSFVAISVHDVILLAMRSIVARRTSSGRSIIPKIGLYLNTTAVTAATSSAYSAESMAALRQQQQFSVATGEVSNNKNNELQIRLSVVCVYSDDFIPLLSD